MGLKYIETNSHTRAPKKNSIFSIKTMLHNCGCPRIEEGSKGLQYYYEDVTIHGPKEERRPRKEGDELKYSKGFQVGTRFWRERKRISILRGSF